MPINFFDENAKTSSSKIRFGLCDDTPPSGKPAYIDEENPDKWIGIINNSTRKQTYFYPIDNCILLYRRKIAKDKNVIIRKIHTFIIKLFDIKEKESSCDGMLRYDNDLIFIELKSRESRHQWLAKGKKQLTITIRKFQKNHDSKAFTKIEAYICNSLRPMASKNYAIEIQKFKDDTGLILNVQQNINI